MDQQVADFFAAAVRARMNIIIGGETASGKTVTLRALAAETGPEERLITIERALELGLEDDEDAHPDIVVMEERLPNAEGEGAVPLDDGHLVVRAMRAAFARMGGEPSGLRVRSRPPSWSVPAACTRASCRTYWWTESPRR
jgi:Flp pilus assembly CpaF family ATPase